MRMRSLFLTATMAGAVFAAGAASASDLRFDAAPSGTEHRHPMQTVICAADRSAMPRGLGHRVAKGIPVSQVLFMVGFEDGETGGPPLARDDAATLGEDAAATPIDVRANDLRATAATITAVTQPPNGTVAIIDAGERLTYQPDPGDCSPTPDMFGYVLAPGGSIATVAVTVECGSVPPDPVAVADSATVPEDSAPSAINVLANDTGTDAQTRIDDVTQPGNGTVTIIDNGTRLTYAPDADYCNTEPAAATDTFTYILTPGGSSAIVSMTVECNGELIIISNGGGDTANLTYPSSSTAPATQVLAVSPDPGPITYAIDGGPDAAAFTLDANNGELRFAMQGDSFPADADNDFVYLLTVRASQGGTTDTQDLAIELVDGLVVRAKYVVALRNGESTDLDVQVLDADGDPIPAAPFTVTLADPVATVAGGVVTATGQPSATSTFAVASGTLAPWNGYSAVRNIVDIAPGYEQPHSIGSSNDFSAFQGIGGTPTISYQGDFFRVTLPAGLVTITMDSGNDLDTYLLLADADGFLVADNDDDDTGFLGVGSRIDYTVPDPGVYLIEASTFNNLDTGNYTLKVQLGP